MKFDAVLFDMDWVLIDSFGWHFNALRQALQDFGFTLNVDEFKELEWIPTIDKIKHLSAKKDISEDIFDKINNKKQEYTKININEWCKEDHEKILIFQNLKNLGLKIACCSSSKRWSVENILTKLWIIDYFDLIISSDDIKVQKPNPDIYLKAMEILWVENKKCIIVEDSDVWIQAAKAAWWFLVKVINSTEVTRWIFENILKY